MMKSYRKIVIVLWSCLAVNAMISATQDRQILYSINMPGNSFQQPYYQIMIKANDKNRTYPLNSATQVQLATFNACYYENECGSTLNNQTMVTSDYVSIYASGLPGNGATSTGNSFLSFVYGLSPYVFRGYVEGAAESLFMQRPAQVQLPFNPLAQIQNQNGMNPTYITATLPDYSDVFLSQKASDIYSSLGCSTNTCDFPSTSDQLPSWYTYIQRKAECGGGTFRGYSTIFYGKMSSLSSPSSITALSLYRESSAWAETLPFGLSNQKIPVTNEWGFTILSHGIFDFGRSWVRTCVWNWYYNNPQFMVFAPIVSPGYAGDGAKNTGALLQTVLASGDLTGNYSVLNTNNPYIASGNPATTYDGIPLTNGMSYFQLFAQNMQWFSLPAPQSTPLPALSSSIPQNITPGQGIFSDAIQLAAMEAPAAISKVPVFTGSLGATTGITGPVTLIGAAPLAAGSVSGNATNFAVPQAFLSELTVDSFKVGHYLQVPLATQGNGTWSGGLVQAAAEMPLQYYQGTTPLESKLQLVPYLPLYMSDPGLELWAPGGSYCPVSLFNQASNAQLCYDTHVSPMTNFYSALNGTRE